MTILESVREISGGCLSPDISMSGFDIRVLREIHDSVIKMARTIRVLRDAMGLMRGRDLEPRLWCTIARSTVHSPFVHGRMPTAVVENMPAELEHIRKGLPPALWKAASQGQAPVGVEKTKSTGLSLIETRLGR